MKSGSAVYFEEGINLTSLHLEFTGSGMSVLSTLALRMVTQEGYENSRRICEKLKKQKFLSTETNARAVRENENDGEKVKNIGEDGSLSKSAKRRLRKKKLKENTLHRERCNEDMETTKDEGKVDMRAYDLVTLAGRRSAKDFFERTLMALFLLKGLQRVRFFNNIEKSNGKKKYTNDSHTRKIFSNEVFSYIYIHHQFLYIQRKRKDLKMIFP